MSEVNTPTIPLTMKAMIQNMNKMQELQFKEQVEVLP